MVAPNRGRSWMGVVLRREVEEINELLTMAVFRVRDLHNFSRVGVEESYHHR